MRFSLFFYAKMINLLDNINNIYAFSNTQVKPGVKITELLQTPNNIDREIFLIVSEANTAIHKGVQDARRLLGQNYLGNIAPLLFKVADLKAILERKLQKSIHRNEVIDLSIKKLLSGKKPAMLLYAYFSEDLRPEIVLIRPDEVDNYDGGEYIRACRQYSIAVALEPGFKEFAEDTIELDLESMEGILFDNGLYDPNALTVAQSEYFRIIHQRLCDAYPYKDERDAPSELNRVIVESYDYLKTNEEFVRQLAPNYFILKNKYKISNEPVSVLEHRDLLVHYLVQTAGLEKYALESIKSFYFEQGSIFELRELEKFQNKNNFVKEKLLGYYTLERSAELIRIIKQVDLNGLQEDARNKIKTGLGYVADLLEKVKPVIKAIKSIEEAAALSGQNKDSKQTNVVLFDNAEVNVESAGILKKILEFIAENTIILAAGGVLSSLFIAMGIYLSGFYGFLTGLAGIALSFTVIVLFSLNKKLNIERQKINLKKPQRNSSVSVKLKGPQTPNEEKEKNPKNSLGAKNDQIIENYIKKELDVQGTDLLPKVIVTLEQLKVLKNHLQYKINLSKELAEFSPIQKYQVLSALVRAIEVPLYSIKKDVPAKFKNEQNVYILVPGVKPLLFLDKLIKEYEQKYDGQAEFQIKNLYAHVLRIAGNKLKSRESR